MFFRRADFLALGGCDPTLLVMEEADLCIRFHRLGRTRLVNRVVITSDRQVATWGALRANWIYLKVGAGWGARVSQRAGAALPRRALTSTRVAVAIIQSAFKGRLRVILRSDDSCPVFAQVSCTPGS